MSDEKTWAVALAVIAVALALCVTLVTRTVSGASTERERICVDAGGTYTLVQNTSKMQCVQ